jgi:ribosomal protein S27E
MTAVKVKCVACGNERTVYLDRSLPDEPACGCRPLYEQVVLQCER